MGTINIHASCVAMGRAGSAFGAPEDAGVLILGESGGGKSDLALRLIERGAILVADDRVELFAQDGKLWSRAPAALAGLIEIRGIGIIALPYQAEAAVALAVQLVPQRAIERLPATGTYTPPDVLQLPQHARPPLVKLVGHENAAPAKVAAAAAAFAHALFCENRNPS